MERLRPTAYRLLLAAVLAAGLWLRCAGLNEEIHLHPDEMKISAWMMRMDRSHSLLPQIYPGGFFVLAKAARTAWDATAGALWHRWQYHVRATDRFHPPLPPPAGFGRLFNAGLGTLAIALIALGARRITCSRAGALTAAALMAFAAYPVEHAHYLETDIAMLATLTLAFWLLTRFLAARRIRDWAWAAFAAGFAAGTKFPLILLLVPLLASVRRPGRAENRPHPAAWLTGLFLLGLLLFTAGFLTASPDAWNVAAFRVGLKQAHAAVYAETAEVLGLAAQMPRAREWLNAINMLHFARSLRAGWLLVAAAGLALCGQRRLRPFWPVTVLFPALYIAYIVFQAPWSRSQEFMVLLPSFCLWAAGPVAGLWNARNLPGRRPAAIALAALAVLPVLQTGVAVASQFAWEDTRRLANRQLQACFPPKRGFAVELFAAPAEDGVTTRTVPILKFKAIPARRLASPDVPSYFLLNSDYSSRGFRDPITRERFPIYEARMGALETEGWRLASWGALDSPAPQPYFRGQRLDFWQRSTPPVVVEEDLGVELPRPTLVRDEGRTTFFKEDLPAGPRPALLVDKFPREIAIGGPGKLEHPVFLVFSTHERAATVRVDGFGRTRRLTLGPYDTGVIPLKRPGWKPRWGRYERVVVRAETGGPDLTYLPCFLRVAFDPVAAAVLLLDDGHPAKAVELLYPHGALAQAGPFWQALAGDSAVRPAATALLARWEEWLTQAGSNPPPVRAGRLPLALWQDFARIRLTPLETAVEVPPAASRHAVSLAAVLPVCAAPQTLALSVARTLARPRPADFAGQILLAAQDGRMLGPVEIQEPTGTNDPALPGTYRSTAFPRQAVLALQSLADTPVAVSNVEFTWNWRDMLAVRADQLRQALAPPSALAAFRYGDWLALRAGRVEAGQALVTFEALQDHIPPLMVQMLVLRKNRWHKHAEAALDLADEPWLRGQPRTVALPLADDLPPEKIGIAVATAVNWHPALLPLAGAPADRPFPLLTELPDAR